MKCKYCEAELLDSTSVCPDCGRDNAEEPEIVETPAEEETAAVEECPVQEEAPAVKEKAKMSTTAKLTVVIVALVVLVAVLASVILIGMNGGLGGSGDTTPDTTAAEPTIPTDGNPDDETCKGTYTAEDALVMAENETVIATMGDKQLTNGELQVYYWMSVYNFLTYNSSYISYLGIDLTQPLDTQICAVGEGGTWQQYFLAQALDSWQRFQSLTVEAEKAEYVMDEEYAAELEGMRSSMEASAAENGYASVEEMLAAQMGGGCTYEDYETYMYQYYMGYLYYSAECEKITITDDEIAAYYEEHKEEYETSGVTEDMTLVDIRHVLIQPEDCTFDSNNYVVATDEQWEACRQEAQALLDDWLANDGTEDGFAAMAKEHTADGNGDVGGLYENVAEGQMVQTFNDWIFDPARVSGDSGLVKTEFGYHIMYFVASNPAWTAYAEQDLLAERQDAVIQAAVDAHPIQVDYSKILLSDVLLAAAS